MSHTAREVLNLASGTLARLFGAADYATIDARHHAWLSWLLADGHEYETWMDAWDAYRAA